MIYLEDSHTKPSLKWGQLLLPGGKNLLNVDLKCRDKACYI